MKSTRIQRRVRPLVIVMVAALAALGANPTTSTDAKTQREWGTAVENQAISIATQKTTYEPGERIVLNIRIKNVGTTAVPMLYPAPFEYDFAVSLVDSPRMRVRDKHQQPILPSNGAVPLTLYGRLKWETLQSTTGPSGELKPG